MRKGYISAVKTEARKVAWPKGSEVRKDTMAVIAVCAFFAVMYWALDSGVLFLLKSVLGKLM